MAKLGQIAKFEQNEAAGSLRPMAAPDHDHGSSMLMPLDKQGGDIRLVMDEVVLQTQLGL